MGGVNGGVPARPRRLGAGRRAAARTARAIAAPPSKRRAAMPAGPDRTSRPPRLVHRRSWSRWTLAGRMRYPATLTRPDKWARRCESASAGGAPPHQDPAARKPGHPHTKRCAASRAWSHGRSAMVSVRKSAILHRERTGQGCCGSPTPFLWFRHLHRTGAESETAAAGEPHDEGGLSAGVDRGRGTEDDSAPSQRRDGLQGGALRPPAATNPSA